MFSKDTEHEINLIIHIIFDIRLDMIIWFQGSCYIYTQIFIFGFFSWIQLSPNFHTFSLPTTITLDLVYNIVLSYCSELPIKVTSSAKSSELINWFETWTPTPALYKEKFEYLKCEKYVYNQNNCCEMYSYLDKHSSRKQSSWYTE